MPRKTWRPVRRTCPVASGYKYLLRLGLLLITITHYFGGWATKFYSQCAERARVLMYIPHSSARKGHRLPTQKIFHRPRGAHDKRCIRGGSTCATAVQSRGRLLILGFGKYPHARRTRPAPSGRRDDEEKEEEEEAEGAGVKRKTPAPSLIQQELKKQKVAALGVPLFAALKSVPKRTASTSIRLASYPPRNCARLRLIVLASPLSVD